MIVWAKRVGSSGAIVTSVQGPMPKRAVGEQCDPSHVNAWWAHAPSGDSGRLSMSALDRLYEKCVAGVTHPRGGYGGKVGW